MASRSMVAHNWTISVSGWLAGTLVATSCSYDKSPADLTEELISWGVLDADARSNSIESF